MSRAFVKEDAGGEDVVVPARPPLPENSPNLVTPEGMRLLEVELSNLRTDHQKVTQSKALDDLERVRALRMLDGQIDVLKERLASAKLTPLPSTLTKVVFGSGVTARVETGKFAGETRQLTIVGVDEAETNEEKIAFTAPLAKALLGCRLGEEVRLEVAGKPQVLKVLAVEEN